MSARCRSCAAPIRWVVTQKGNRMPVDAEPDLERGNVLVDNFGNAVYLTAEQRQRYIEKGGKKLYLSHFASCPNASQHRVQERRTAVRNAMQSLGAKVVTVIDPVARKDKP